MTFAPTPQLTREQQAAAQLNRERRLWRGWLTDAYDAALSAEGQEEEQRTLRRLVECAEELRARL